MDILAICGSLRRGSFNHGLLRAAQDLAPPGMAIRIVLPGDLPLYDGDLEARGWPQVVAALRERCWEADGLLFGCPEYNYGISGVLKNAVDWISRPEGAGGNPPRPGPRNPFVDKPCALLGASPGMGGTIRAQLQLRQSLQLSAGLVMPQPEMFVAGAASKFDADSNLTDGTTRDLLRKLLEAFAAWVARVGPAARQVPLTPPREAGGPRSQPNKLDEAIEESFPASDPPSR